MIYNGEAGGGEGGIRGEGRRSRKRRRMVRRMRRNNTTTTRRKRRKRRRTSLIVRLLGGPLGPVLDNFGSLVGCVEAIWGFLERS